MKRLLDLNPQALLMALLLPLLLSCAADQDNLSRYIEEVKARCGRRVPICSRRRASAFG